MDHKKRKHYPTQDQKQMLTDLLKADPELCAGKFSSTFSKKEGEKRWSVIANQINALSGANKPWDEWRKTWQDMKSKAKKKEANRRRMCNLTGGGPPPDPVSPEQLQIIETISDYAISGHNDSHESVVNMIDLWKNKKQEPAPAAAGSSGDVSNCRPLDVEVIIDDLSDESNFKENKRNEKKTLRTVSQRRLQKSLEVAEKLEKNLKHKSEFKKKFCEDYIEQMKLQTRAMEMQARALSQIAQTLKSPATENQDAPLEDHNYV